jgi:hypothetical protein
MTLAHVLNIPLINTYYIEVATAALSRIAIDDNGNRRLVFHDGRAG